jgi:mxaL protein
VNALRRAWAFVRGQRLAILALALIVLLPVFFTPHVRLPGSTYAWLFVIDITESMNVRDVDARRPDASRLDRAKASVVAALANLPCGSTAAVALFAGTDTVTLFEPLEVCAHFPAIEQAVRNIDWRMAWDGDSRIEAALVNAIGEAEKRHLDLVFVTDGDEAPHVDVPRLGDLLALRGPVRGWLLGVGSAEPHPVPRLDAENRIVGYWTAIDAARQGFHPNLVEAIDHASAEDLEKSGAFDDVVEHRSALRAAYLKQLGTAAGLGYETADSDDTLAKLTVDAKLRRKQEADRDVRFVFGLAAALLVLIDRLGLHGRTSTRRRSDAKVRVARTRVA